MGQRPTYAVDETEPTGPRRRISFWTIVAPVGALALFVVFFVALGNSCISNGCDSNDDDAAEEDKPANDLKAGARAKIKPGDSVGSIAAKYNLTMDEIQACNPTVDAQTIQPGQYLVVSAASCEGADRAEVGANPDPLAGETSAVPKPKTNATAAADPSLRGGAAAKTSPPAQRDAPAEGAAPAEGQ